MWSLRATAVATAGLCALGAAQRQDAPAEIDFGGKLYRSVFSSAAGVLAPADLAAVPEPLQSRLSKYLARRAAFKSSYTSEPDDFQRVRRVLERAIVSLVDTAGIERAAAEFVGAAPIASEWQGLPEGPVAEATFAENVLKKDPASPLAPWLYIFIAHRQRIAFEAYENQRNEEGMKAAAKKYRAFVERARGAGDPIYGVIADDMERQPSLYIKGTQHPRGYDPDT
jgi:hypothetical protein